MAAEIHSRPHTARPVLLNKIEGHSDAVTAAVLIPKEDGVITVSEDRRASPRASLAGRQMLAGSVYLLAGSTLTLGGAGEGDRARAVGGKCVLGHARNRSGARGRGRGRRGLQERVISVKWPQWNRRGGRGTHCTGMWIICGLWPRICAVLIRLFIVYGLN